jgi:hypothetical protein
MDQPKPVRLGAHRRSSSGAAHSDIEWLAIVHLPSCASRIMSRGERLRIGSRVVLVAVPPGLLDGLPTEDQRAIRAIVGKPVTFLGYDERGDAELHFADPFVVQTDKSTYTHSIWVSPKFIEPYRRQRAGKKTKAVRRTAGATSPKTKQNKRRR